MTRLEAIKEMLNDHDLIVSQFGCSLADAGIDSLELVQIMIDFEERTGIEIDDSKLGAIKTVGDLILSMETYGSRPS